MDRDDAIVLYQLALAAAGRQDLPDALIVLPLALLPAGLRLRVPSDAWSGVSGWRIVMASDLGDWLAAGDGRGER